MKRFEAVLLLGPGGPNTVAEIPVFLHDMGWGKNTPQSSYERQAEKYLAIESAYKPLDFAMRQMKGLKILFAQEKRSLGISVGMRHWHPFIGEAMAHMADSEVKKVVAVLMEPFPADGTWNQYQEVVSEGCMRLGKFAPEITFLPQWHTDERFIDATADRLNELLEEMPEKERSKTFVLYTAFGLSPALDRIQGYGRELYESIGQISLKAPVLHWALAYQKRLGNPQEHWLMPDIKSALIQISDGPFRNVIVVPLGMIADQIELLYDLDVEAKCWAEALGLTYLRTQTIGDHPHFLKMLSEKIVEFEQNPTQAPSVAPPAAGAPGSLLISALASKLNRA